MKTRFILIIFFFLMFLYLGLDAMWDHPESIPTAWDTNKFVIGIIGLTVSVIGVLIATKMIEMVENLRRKNDEIDAERPDDHNHENVRVVR